jgi:hypothetical protein
MDSTNIEGSTIFAHYLWTCDNVMFKIEHDDAVREIRNGAQHLLFRHEMSWRTQSSNIFWQADPPTKVIQVLHKPLAVVSPDVLGVQLSMSVNAKMKAFDSKLSAEMVALGHVLGAREDRIVTAFAAEVAAQMAQLDPSLKSMRNTVRVAANFMPNAKRLKKKLEQIVES